ncbi:uncharacterized protein B0J16DRAFT_403471 [Fusarium flagelliforme]|uniref:uncharacterized protein n=1 Tax=Fusarium flagelliforme TaxID=2675880 RepID=UPI001E8EA82F|nr:uncharacterized protein B0J16DRAFT_403471 [Fusarium flagelliforme]KAH7180054.1 hypothetical protein B0J16DRAFT_403471 [Fusarium flagelliforme]
MARIRIISPPSVSSGPSDVEEWHFPTDLESEISTLATSCHVQQQQREPIVQSVQQNEDDTLDSMDDGECTKPFSTLTLDNDVEMKRGFLDRLAELLCFDKKPDLITSTALVSDRKDNIILCARNSSPRGNTWSTKDVNMLENLAGVLEKTSSGEPFDFDPLPELQKVLVEYYRQRIVHHAKQLISLERGITGMAFFNNEACSAIASGRVSIHQFAEQIEVLSDSTDFFRILKTKLSPPRLRRILDELAFIRRPMQGAIEFLLIAQKCTWFRNLQIHLLNSLPSRKVGPWNLPQAEINLNPKQEVKFKSEIKKRQNIHAEMMLMYYIFNIMRHGLVMFPYLGVSKKTCLLCGHLLREMIQFDTRGNHGKCYSQWTLPPVLKAIPSVTERLDKAVVSLQDILREEAQKEMAHMDAEKESLIAPVIPPRHVREADIFNEVSKDPVLLSREAEWFSSFRRLDVGNTRLGFTNNSRQGSPDAPNHDAENPKLSGPPSCPYCRETGELAYKCPGCSSTTYCDKECYREDWYQHKFSCALGRPIDATDKLILACHKNIFPEEEDVARAFGCSCFISGTDKSRLFRLYRRLIVDWKVDESELRAALDQNKLREMLTFRCGQTNDPSMLSDKDWLKAEERFKADGEYGDLITLFEAAQEELLSADDRKLSWAELQPREKQQALLFYVQSRNGYKPDADEDNWISLGLCTAPDAVSETQLCMSYALLIQHCTFDEFWNCIAKSSIVELFGKYGLAHTILHIRNFKDHMAHVKKWYPSVWGLKRFTRIQDTDPFRAVHVDYGFMNCTDARQRMQLREIYRRYFNEGHDEMSLHKACISGELASFLESVLGALAVPSQLLKNPYPLENCPLMGMVAHSVVACPESALDQVRQFSENDSLIITIPDSEDEDCIRILHQRAAFLGTGLRRRYYSQAGSKCIVELKLE